MGRAARRPGPARPGPAWPGPARPGPAGSVREYSRDIKLCINDFYGLAGRHSLAHAARCGSSEAFSLRNETNIYHDKQSIQQLIVKSRDQLRTTKPD